jgi:hypothetical protein
MKKFEVRKSPNQPNNVRIERWFNENQSTVWTLTIQEFAEFAELIYHEYVAVVTEAWRHGG